MIDRAQILARAAAGDADAEREAVPILLGAMRAYFRADGDLSLERCCGLPSSAARRRRAELRRDYWLSIAHGQMEARDPWPRSCQLHSEIDRFEHLIWPVWRDLSEPPHGTSKLREALFHALRAAYSIKSAKGDPRMPRSIRRLHDVVKSFGDAVSQAD